ncbi:DNA polymerase II large subunit [archaeon SCG-AAA382B04]|nr:DNA polymerase II large subunit [archaeon SCG-AAA382B04]
MNNYFKKLEKRFEESYELAKRAREKGKDSSQEVEVLPANDLAERVENLIGIEGLTDLISELEAKGYDREKICLKITDSLINKELGQIRSKSKIAETAVRTSVAILTEGIVAAPIEGISEVAIEGKDDYLRISYSGPIRSAGGTAQVVSVLVGDYVRRKLNIGRFEATEAEKERYTEEIPLYKRLKNLQYTPSKEEINTIIGNCPILVDGESTEDEEVSGQRNLDRIGTNQVRGGMCLVVAEGLALKAPKLKRLVKDLDIRGWRWLDDLIKKDEDEDGEEDKGDVKYLSDLIAGRPVFSHPSRPGGFRLRYGRSRNSGLATAGINPASMYVLGNFLSSGTQIKFEKPGKAAGIVSVDSIEGPTVKLADGEVKRIDDSEVAKELKDEIVEILDVGEMLINYGDFLENNHKLSTPSFTQEWWELLANRKNITPSISSAKDAIKTSKNHNSPLHPDYTYLWHDIDVDSIKKLRQTISKRGEYEKELKIPNDPQIKQYLEVILVEHTINENKITLKPDNSLALLASLGLNKDLKMASESEKNEPIEYINDISSLEIKKRAPTRIGCRMGRPEKSKERKMNPPTHLLFPLGEAGGKERSVEKAASKLNISVQVGRRKCPECEEITYKKNCPKCETHTELIRKCPNCDIIAQDKCPKCSRDTSAIKEFNINLSEEYRNSLENLNERNNYDKLKGVKGLTSKDKSPEPLEKGILRAKHDQYVFKDGTIRYDLTDLPLTHFRPKEINTSIKELKELGYTEDINGKELKNTDQVLELKVQDVILSNEACEYLLNTTKFLDDLLEKYYELEPYYEAEDIEDLKGTLLVGLAPHTSAGVLSRLIGSTKTQANYAHPYFHAAKRRNCDGDEDCYMMLLDGLLNFSRSYLPDKTGGRMDAPLVLTYSLDPKEVDDEAHNIDILNRYPVEFYQAAVENKGPKEVDIEIGEDRLDSKHSVDKFGYTTETNDINSGPKESCYKKLGPMVDKTQSQLELAKKIRAVDEKDVAQRIIESHFLPDLMGNLRAFSTQRVRCVKCNKKFRRPPLRGKCPECGGALTLTVHENSVKKYLGISKEVAEEYDVSSYVKERLDILELSMESLFENDLYQQKGLSDFM